MSYYVTFNDLMVIMYTMVTMIVLAIAIFFIIVSIVQTLASEIKGLIDLVA